MRLLAIVGGAAGLAAWLLRGLALVEQQGGAWHVVAAGPVGILTRAAPLLVLAAVLALTLAGARAARAGRAAGLAELNDERQEIEGERARLNKARELLSAEDHRLAELQLRMVIDARRVAAEVEAERQVLAKCRAYVERLEAELRGARDHIKRLKKRAAAKS